MRHHKPQFATMNKADATILHQAKYLFGNAPKPFCEQFCMPTRNPTFVVMLKRQATKCRTLVAVIVFGAALFGCGSSDSPPIGPPTTTPPTSPTLPESSQGLPVPDNRTVNEFRVLLLGNSHVGFNNLGGLLKQMIQTGRPQASVQTETGGGAGYLDERLHDNVSVALVNQQHWSHVILQGQKYSTSGLYHYPINAALYWVALIKSRQGTPILFPEHATLGNPTEGARVYQLHQSIVEREAACLAPIPQAWESNIQQWPGIALHIDDGNHASLAGSVLTAMLFYQVITGNPADQLPYIASINLSATIQQRLAQQASASLQQYPACPF